MQLCNVPSSVSPCFAVEHISTPIETFVTVAWGRIACAAGPEEARAQIFWLRRFYHLIASCKTRQIDFKRLSIHGGIHIGHF